MSYAVAILLTVIVASAPVPEVLSGPKRDAGIAVQHGPNAQPGASFRFFFDFGRG